MADEQKKPQLMRYNDSEMALIKQTFRNNYSLLTAIRKVILQAPLNGVDLSMLEISFTKRPELYKIVRKTILPELDAEAPLNQIIDLWLTCPLKELPPDIGFIHLKSIKIWIDYLNQQVALFESGDYSAKPKIKLKDMEDIMSSTPDDAYAAMLARNTIINSTEQQLNQLLFLADYKVLTPEEQQEKDKKNSSK